MIDLHCDTMMQLLDHPQSGDLYENAWKIDIKKLWAGHSKVQDFALYIDLGETEYPYERYQAMRQVFEKNVLTYGEHIRHIQSVQDLDACYADGKLGALLSVEEGGVFEGSLERLDKAYEEGVRLITISWNYPNGLCEPHCGDPNKGLTELGRAFVQRMEELGIIVDCSHLNDGGIAQLDQLMTKPFIASHSNARALTPHSRNLTDQQIRMIARKGGVIGLNFANHFLGDSPISRIDDIVRHGLYIYKVGGADVVALGTDFDGIDPQTEIQDIGHMDRLRDAFLKAGMTQGDLDKLFWKNADRLLREII